MENLRYDRLCRTPFSEAYLIRQENTTLGRVELHFASNDIVYGLLVVEREMSEAELHDLVGQIDEDLVWSADLPREDFVVTVYQGRELGTYSDEDVAQEEQGNGAGEPI